MKRSVYKKILFSSLVILFIHAAHGQHVVVHKRVPPRGRTVVRVDNSVKVVHRGTTLHYSKGVFYRPVVGRGYVVVAPPIGVRVVALPPHYARLVVRGVAFYYYNGIYYQKEGSTYQVVVAPVGARVSALPPGYKLKLINGQKFYIVDATFYQEVIIDQTVNYEVVAPPSSTETKAMIGARLPRLPEASELAIIDNQKYYVSNGTYYKEIIENNTIWYEVVGEN